MLQIDRGTMINFSEYSEITCHKKFFRIELGQ